MEAESTVGSVVVDELKKQARAEGYVVLAFKDDDLWLYAALAVYFLLGYAWGSTR